VFVTHLSLSENARRRVAPEIAQAIQDARASGYRVIIMGDFNAEPQSDLLKFLRSEISILGTKGKLTRPPPLPWSKDTIHYSFSEQLG